MRPGWACGSKSWGLFRSRRGTIRALCVRRFLEAVVPVPAYVVAGLQTGSWVVGAPSSFCECGSWGLFRSRRCTIRALCVRRFLEDIVPVPAYVVASLHTGSFSCLLIAGRWSLITLSPRDLLFSCFSMSPPSGEHVLCVPDAVPGRPALGSFLLATRHSSLAVPLSSRLPAAGEARDPSSSYSAGARLSTLRPPKASRAGHRPTQEFPQTLSSLGLSRAVLGRLTGLQFTV